MKEPFYILDDSERLARVLWISRAGVKVGYDNGDQSTVSWGDFSAVDNDVDAENEVARICDSLGLSKARIQSLLK